MSPGRAGALPHLHPQTPHCLVTPKFCNYLPTAAIIAVGGMNVVSAANPLPAWYGEPGSTRTDYIFDNASLTPAPSLTENPFGSPAATVTLGQFAAGWQRPNTYDLSGVDNDGAWDLGKAGSISVTVPFAQTVPLAGMNFSVDFQVYSVDYRASRPCRHCPLPV